MNNPDNQWRTMTPEEYAECYQNLGQHYAEIKPSVRNCPESVGVTVFFGKPDDEKYSKLQAKLKNKTKACRELNKSIVVKNLYIKLYLQDINSLLEEVKKIKCERNRLRQMLVLSLDWLDCACDEGSDLSSNEGVAVKKKIEQALKDIACF